MSRMKYPINPALIVDDEEQVLVSNKMALVQGGITNVETCQDSREVMGRLAESEHSLVMLDLRMPHITGEELLPMIMQEYPDLPVIVITGFNDLETAVRCMKNGAFDFLVKPVEKNRLTTTVKHAVAYFELRRENTMLSSWILSDEVSVPEAFIDIVTRNQKMLQIFRYLDTVAQTGRPVLITGETGVGKELIARAVHSLSGRESLVTINVAALDDNIFSDTLFGHLKGAFTGADRFRPGLVEKASGGTLFLDEIGDLDPASQVKLLRLLQEGEYMPLGADETLRSDARILVATNCDLKRMQQKGTFRKDLYYRLKEHHVHIPPLRERKDDLPILVDHFVEQAAKELGRRKPTTPPELLTLLATYHFPGNIRELKSMIYEAITGHRSGKLSLSPFRQRLDDVDREEDKSNKADKKPDIENEFSTIQWPEVLPSMSEMDKLQIDEALRRSDGNQTIAARLLGITPSALSQRLKRLKSK